jgi:hypothetical protein
MTEREQFSLAYWASEPPEVRALNGMERLTIERVDAAQQLAAKGFPIDAEIDAYGLNPWDTMRLREMNGYTWYPSLFQGPVVMAPGLTAPGAPVYDPLKPPAGSIKVSTKLEDYPPFNPPVVPEVPAVPQGVPWIERVLGVGKCAVMPGDVSPSGTTYMAADGSLWEKRIVSGPFGAWAWWEVAK